MRLDMPFPPVGLLDRVFDVFNFGSGANPSPYLRPRDHSSLLPVLTLTSALISCLPYGRNYRMGLVHGR